MGPQLYRCGDMSSPDGSMTTPALQWGRNFIVAETLRTAFKEVQGAEASMGPQLYRCGDKQLAVAGRVVGRLLQWGRNFIVVETFRATTTQTTDIRCFNGAATLSLRRLVICHCGIWQDLSFNGAATLSLRRPVTGKVRMRIYSTLQWGRNFIVAETEYARGGARYPIRLQWGRNFIVAET